MPWKSRLPAWLLTLSLVAIAAATLRPGFGDVSTVYIACVFCGAHATADALINIILFAPLGAGAGLFGWSVKRSVIGALLVSLSVEFAQLFLPGRDPSVGDVLFNTTGAILGLTAVLAWRSWLIPGPRERRVLLVVAGLFPVLAFGATALLLQPSLPASTYFGQWSPNLAHLEWYRARVAEVRIGEAPVPSHELENSAEIRRLLLVGAPLAVRAVAGPAVPGVGSLFSIADDSLREIVLVGPDREDLVWRFRTRAADFRLDSPDLRVIGAMGRVAPGEPMTVSVWHEPSGWCVELQFDRSCGLGFSLRDGWAFLMFPEPLPRWLKAFLGKAWLAGLLLPVGLYARREAGSVLAALVGLGSLLLLPQLAGTRPATGADFAAAAGGIVVGAWLARALRAPAARA